jgi:hypothetical protein
VAIAALLVGLCAAAPARADSAPSLIVLPSPASGPSLSYFKLSVERGRLARAGTIGLRNPTDQSLRVVLDPVAGETIDTLGSTYGVAGSAGAGSARWVRLGQRAITLAPRATAVIPVSVRVPPTATPGDYLAGIAVEQLGQRARSSRRGGVAVASVVRYAIGIETSLPGPRQPLIAFTGARLEHQPSGLAFHLDARNPGNVILQNVTGEAVITRGSRVVARAALGPGTFVTGTSIAYPVLATREHPSEGTVYRVRAYLRYAGGVARLDTLVRFGHAAALGQQLYGGPAAGTASAVPGWLVALVGVLAAAGLAFAARLLLRGRSGAGRSPVRTIESALEAARLSGEPMGLISVSVLPTAGAAPELARILRSRMRQADRICRLDAHRFLVVAPDTDPQTTEVLAADLRRHAQRGDGAGAAVEIEVQATTGQASAAEALERIRTATQPAHAPAPSD